MYEYIDRHTDRQVGRQARKFSMVRLWKFSMVRVLKFSMVRLFTRNLSELIRCKIKKRKKLEVTKASDLKGLCHQFRSS
jgi:hypothetical protein